MLIDELKDLYHGEPVFLVGNGPSLKDTPLELLMDRHSFGMNRLTSLYKRTAWRPEFYVCLSSDFKQVQRPEFEKSAAPARVAFLPAEFGGEKIVGLNADEEQWSDDPSVRVSKYGTVMLAAFQVAVYMGFNPIVLVGCDLNFGPDGNHYDPDYTLSAEFDWHLENLNQLEAHRIAKWNCDRLGVAVYNATVGGALAVYPRVRLEDVL
jgi:hypothetical protein